MNDQQLKSDCLYNDIQKLEMEVAQLTIKQNQLREKTSTITINAKFVADGRKSFYEYRVDRDVYKLFIFKRHSCDY